MMLCRWLLLTSLVLVGCGASGDTSSGGDDTTGQTDLAADLHRALLTSLADQVILPTYRDFHTACKALETAAATYKGSMSEGEHAAVQEAWRSAMVIWQRAEVLQIGPAGSMTSVIGGQDIRAEIYSWPTVNPCRVDQELVEAAYVDVDAFAGELTNVRGLDALEYLLFGPEFDNDCKPNSAINEDGSWQALVDSGEMPERRAAYAHGLAVLLERDAAALVNVWEEGAPAFLAELTGAGTSSQVYATAQEALNSVSDAMFYVEKQTKDMKLAVPAGISGCDADVCPEELESLWAHHSKENVLANIEALQLLFLGGETGIDASGFDDLLVGMGREVLATEMTDKLAAAHSAVEAVEGSLAEALSAGPGSIEAAYEALKAALDLFKTEFVGSLDLEIPNRVAADND
jgi:uncharacterized protein